MESRDSIRVLFVCLGNICRSPLAEGVFRQLTAAAGLEDRFEVDSAGTSAWHEGDAPDERTVAEARRRGMRLTGRAHRVRSSELTAFDYVLAMDSTNLEELRLLADDAGTSPRLELLRHYDPDANGHLDVPDPYFGGEHGFRDVHDIVERSCAHLLRRIRDEHGL